MFSESAIAPQSHRIRFRLAGGAQPLMLVPVHVNGRGPHEFILDTGAGTTILTPDLSTMLALKSTGSKEGQTAGGKVNVLLAKVQSIALGSVQREDLDVAITDLSHLERVVGAKIAGDLGYNFLKHFRLTIDFRNSQLAINEPRHALEFPSAVAEVKFRLAAPAKPLILVQAHLNGRGPFQLALDTGTSTTAISPQLARDLNLRQTVIPPVTTGGATINVSAARIESLAVEGAVLRDMDVIVGDFLEMLSTVIGVRLDGIIGHNFLKLYKVVIDYPNETLALLPP